MSHGPLFFCQRMPLWHALSLPEATRAGDLGRGALSDQRTQFTRGTAWRRAEALLRGSPCDDSWLRPLGGTPIRVPPPRRLHVCHCHETQDCRTNKVTRPTPAPDPPSSSQGNAINAFPRRLHLGLSGAFVSPLTSFAPFPGPQHHHNGSSSIVVSGGI